MATADTEHMRVIPFVWLEYVEPELLRVRWNRIVKLLRSRHVASYEKCAISTPHNFSQVVQHVADILMESYGYPSHFVYRRRPIRFSPTVDALLIDIVYENYLMM